MTSGLTRHHCKSIITRKMKFLAFIGKNDARKADSASAEKDYCDILGNGLLLKKIIKSGIGRCPKFGEKVLVHIQQEIPDLDKILPDEQLEFILGDGDVIQALELTVPLMKVGETCQVISGFRFMYGEQGLEPDVPPRSNIKLTLKLLENRGPLNFVFMDYNARLAEIMKKKERGNFLYKREDYAQALYSYTKASRLIDRTAFHNPPAKDLQELQELLAIVKCNSCACQFKLEDYKSAVRSGLEAVAMKPTYGKAYIRLGQAQEQIGDLDGTIESYKLALKYDTENTKWLRGELEKCIQINRSNKLKQKEMYAKMLKGPSKELNGARPKTLSVPQASLSYDVKSEMPRQALSPKNASHDPNKSASTVLPTSTTDELSNTSASETASAKTIDEELQEAMRDYMTNFPNDNPKLNPQQVKDLSEELMAFVPPEVLEEMDRMERAPDAVRYGGIRRSRKSFENAKGDLGMKVPKGNFGMIPNFSAIQKGEPMSKPKVEDNQSKTTCMFYDVGTDVDTGEVDVSKDPPSCVLEVSKPSAITTYIDEDKSSWWKIGAAVLGVGLAGLAGVGIYKYFKH